MTGPMTGPTIGPATGPAATGYLNRMAARATGSGLESRAAAAAPRVRSRFEPVPPEVGEAGVEPDPTRPADEPSTDLEAGAPAAAQRRGRGPRQRVAHVADEPPSGEPLERADRPSEARAASSYRTPDGEPMSLLRAADGPASGLGPRASDVGLAEEPARRAASDAPREPSARAIRSANGAPVPATAVPAHPVTPAVVTTPQPTLRAAEQPREPDVVVVSVGRVDVRAVLAPTPPQPAPPRTAPAETLSLHDYLRGRREG